MFTGRQEANVKKKEKVGSQTQTRKLNSLIFTDEVKEKAIKPFLKAQAEADEAHALALGEAILAFREGKTNI